MEKAEPAQSGYDIFISHASEDKDGLVRELAIALRNLGVSVWYDEFTLRPGDSLSRSIDKGLAASRFGLVVISPAFLKKPWTEYELRGLVSKEIDQGKTIIPVWHGVGRSEVLAFSPTLADKIALKTEGLSVGDLALQVLQEVRPQAYLSRSRDELQRVAREHVIDVLADEVEEARRKLSHAEDRLSELTCPTCGAPLVVRGSYPNPHCDSDELLYERYECGCEEVEHHTKRPCPYDPRYPQPDDYELKCSEDGRGGWVSYAVGKTYMAQQVDVMPGRGNTREQALEDIRRRLPQRRTRKTK